MGFQKLNLFWNEANNKYYWYSTHGKFIYFRYKNNLCNNNQKFSPNVMKNTVVQAFTIKKKKENTGLSQTVH